MPEIEISAVSTSRNLFEPNARQQQEQQQLEEEEEEEEEEERSPLPFLSSHDFIARELGAGLGLYFKALHWLFWMMLGLLVCAVPFLIAVNTAVFTTYSHRYDATFGIKVYDNFELPSFTFAAIVDDKKDGGMLQYMFNDIGGVWKGPSRKGVFLTWISAMDAFATAAVTAAVAVLLSLVRSWLRDLDQKTREVSKYAVLVCGLPPKVNAKDVGKYFSHSRFLSCSSDKVVDVVLISIVAPVIKECRNLVRKERLKSSGKVDSKTKQLRRAEARAGQAGDGGGNGGWWNLAVLLKPFGMAVDLVAQLGGGGSDDKRTYMQGQLKEAMHRVSRPTVRDNVAIVTFNTEQMRAKVCSELPSNAWASWFMLSELQLEHDKRKWRLWVRRAAAPDDYCFENLTTSRSTGVAIQVCLGLLMALLIIVCAVLITWLSAASNKATRLPSWDLRKLGAAVGSGGPGSNQTSNTTYCASFLSTCKSFVGAAVRGVDVNLTFGSRMVFPNESVRLLNERPVRQELITCAKDASCRWSRCLSCYCLGLSSSSSSWTQQGDITPDLLLHVSDTCSDYFKPFDFRRDGLAVAISLVIAIINILLIELLKLFKIQLEKHWTTSNAERSFAIWAYVVQMINSVAVLLVVNCSTIGKLQKKAVKGEQPWVQQLVLDGLYDDFTPEWYASVGVSIMGLILINTLGPLIDTAVSMGLQAILRMVASWRENKSPGKERKNKPLHRSVPFTLGPRIADVMVNVSLALMFGSGVPLCYLITAVYLGVRLFWDRLQLLIWCQPVQRYKENLLRVVLHLLPVVLLVHCAFGLWMHTYFEAVMSPGTPAPAPAPGEGSPSRNSVGRRITQPNGLPLLIWFSVLGLWLVGWMLQRLGRCCSCSNRRRKAVQEKQSGLSDVTYEQARETSDEKDKLKGDVTYRITDLKRYKPFIEHGVAKQLIDWAQNQQKFKDQEFSLFKWPF